MNRKQRLGRPGNGRRAFGRPTVGLIETLETRHALAVDVVNALPDVTAAQDASPAVIALANRYDDTAVTGTVVRFDVNSPAPLDKIYVELFDQAGAGRTRTTPATVANFLSYVDGGHYQNTFIHRSVPDFVVQAGGFNVTGTNPISIGNVTQFASVVNEPGNTNVRGTIAMAKLGSDPNSATNQWFFSLADNSGNLDNQNGGFTAFGRVLGSGMTAVDALAAVPRFGYSSPFDTVPLRDVPGANPSTDPSFTNAAVDTGTLNSNQFVKFPSIVRVGELVYTVSTTAPTLVTPTIEADGSLKLVYAPGATGTGSVTVRATSVFDATSFTEDTFQVTVGTPAAPAPPAPNAIIGLAGSELIVSRATSGTFATSAAVPLPAAETWVNAVSGDFDGDGLTDTATQTSAGAWWVTRTTATGTEPAVPWATLAVYQFPTVGDFDADGKDDIAIRNEANGAWRVLTSTGSAFTSTRFGRWNATLTWGNVAAGDFNADGKDDLVGQRSDGAWVVATSTGTAFVSNIWAFFAVDQFGTVGDFNADGKDDVAVRNAVNGAWRVLVSDGSTFTAVKFGTWATDTTWSNVRAGDFDGDGRTDLLGQRADGTWFVSQSTGSTFITSAWAVFSTGQFTTVGDFNADGRADVAVRNSANGAWRILSSTGTAFTSAKAGNWPAATAWARAFAAHA
jgi:cyclophilin family peptidyl-prolyl cis-trans isomerase